MENNELIIYNIDETEVLDINNLDLTKGFLELREKIIEHAEIKAIEEQGHYEVIHFYDNGSRDVEWKIDIPKREGVAAWTETKQYQVYIPYTELEIEERQLSERMESLKQELARTDYQAMKYAEGWFTAEQYEPIKQGRQVSRDEINRIQERLFEIQSQKNNSANLL